MGMNVAHVQKPKGECPVEVNYEGLANRAVCLVPSAHHVASQDNYHRLIRSANSLGTDKPASCRFAPSGQDAEGSLATQVHKAAGSSYSEEKFNGYTMIQGPRVAESKPLSPGIVKLIVLRCLLVSHLQDS